MKHSSAFTLIELSIVLVIIGLIVGGVLAGRDLIKTAELRNVISEKERFSAAVYTFREKYNALPGDMANATDYWGAQDPVAATCVNTASTTQLTCNGNGDGEISYLNSVPNTWEGLRAWQHLANAGLVPGRFDGHQHGSASIPDVNVPRTRLSDSGVWNVWFLRGRSEWSWAPPDMGTYLVLGSIQGPATGLYHNAILKPEDAMNIDKKLDDGKPYTGSVNDMMSYTPNCTTNETISVDYNISYKNLGCMLFFKIF